MMQELNATGHAGQLGASADRPWSVPTAQDDQKSAWVDDSYYIWPQT